MMESFLELKTPDEVFEIIDLWGPVEEVIVSIEDSLDRVLSRDLTAPENLPTLCALGSRTRTSRLRDGPGALHRADFGTEAWWSRARAG